MTPPVRLEFDAVSEKFFFRMARKTPNLFKRTMGAAARNAQRAFHSVMVNGGGKHGVPKLAKHAALSEQLVGKWVPGKRPGTRTRRKLFDGKVVKLASDKFYHARWISLDSSRGMTVQHVGFPDKKGLDKFVSGLLEARSQPFTEYQKAMFHRAGVKNVPEMYERPERHIIEPFAEYLTRGVYVGWVKKIFDKELAKELAKKA